MIGVVGNPIASKSKIKNKMAKKKKAAPKKKKGGKKQRNKLRKRPERRGVFVCDSDMRFARGEPDCANYD